MFASLLFGQSSNDGRVLLQGFYWDAHDARPEGWYNYVNSLAPGMATAGIDMIWLPPPSNAGSDEGYLPRELNNLSNAYGTEADHRALLQNLNNLGIEPIADIVINHRVGSTNWLDFTNPTWPSTSITADDEVWGQPQYAGLPRGGYDDGSSYGPARDIDHSNPYVQGEIITWLNYLKAAGYKGWRYDYVHGYHPWHINNYNTNTAPTFSVGENWKGKQEIQDWIDGTSQKSTAFDFPTYYALKSTIKDNNYSYLAFYNNGTGKMEASGLIGWSPSKSVTFVENHDTPRYDPSNNILNGGNVGQAYAYLLTHPGVPTIYWEHYYDWGVKSEIDALIAIRKEFGITNTSTLEVKASSASVYAAVVNGNVAVKLGYGNWSPALAGFPDAAQWELKTYGNNYAVWGKGSTPPPTSAPLVIHFKGNYSSPTLYYWAATPNGGASSSWPGGTMTAEGNGWYRYEIPNADCSNLIFSDNGANKTADLNRCGEGWYTNGQWYDSNPDDVPPPPPGNGFTVYFKPSGYSNPTIYFWATDPAGESTTWPGETMTDAGNGWYSYTFSSANCANVIFSNNGANQTADLYRCGNGWYTNGQWYDSNPEAGSGDSFTVHFRPSGYSNPKIYFWNATPAGPTTTWPGEAMTPEGNGWYSYTFNGASCSNIIFSNNGANQTADLYRCGDGWYQNGSWSSSGSRTTVPHPKTDELAAGVYPNPFGASLTISVTLPETAEVGIQFFDLTGRMIENTSRQLANGHQKLSVNTDNWKPGLYLYRITTPQKTFGGRVVKE